MVDIKNSRITHLNTWTIPSEELIYTVDDDGRSYRMAGITQVPERATHSMVTSSIGSVWFNRSFITIRSQLFGRCLIPTKVQSDQGETNETLAV
ncbi:hypothetical protein PAXRUDRAFT_673140 [Paxillus rubicundulus Ve08.2h10]|uniref:Uncharacterized protein n=1 Tax=Paxillus rubicundulus Ve08.2h10 TaxID=930991 RepID=A0A0D0E1R6_9AGAM|nr:hypothetical protein PAXRUDRAFT_673140 [Paxillus rubicundulus Ve08.2h10]